MSEFCTFCGAVVPDGCSFCVSCGSSIVDDVFAYPQAQAVSCACCGAPLELDGEFCVVCGTPVAREARQAVLPNPVVPVDASREGGRKNGAGAGLMVVLGVIAALAVVGVAVAVLVVAKPWGTFGIESASEPASEKGSTVAVVEAPASSGQGKDRDNDQDEAESSDAKKPTVVQAPSESEQYAQLDALYDKLDGFDKRVHEAATGFNNQFLSSNYEVRKGGYDAADRLNEDIIAASEQAIALDIPASSRYYGSWGDICTLYECLLHRVDVICEAWQLSMQYSDPAPHEEEILALLAADHDESGNNKYYNAYKQLYPTVHLEAA